ncbi:hypothetical protein JDS91_30865 [Bacillus cereus]|uniref:hypothetical protein n=1 Tax=Bacillus cereus group TaxID=86661 RepID=UPI0018F5FC23|nr:MULTISPECIES: hypothetical protein [Bacillus cereus group]MBJ8154505.1 hypothetical protein [Bacillus cereus]MBJ8205626.1 hypothetical protein [Bacillus cereus]HDR7738254.1 hypothetical protein [Bacillus thuringiensis]
MNKKCPNCGSREIEEDLLNAQECLKLISTNNLFNQFSRVVADICTECGNILSIKVEHPEYFRVDT